MLYQLGSLSAFCAVNGVRLIHVKPAANLYHMALEKEDIAKACVEAIAKFDPNLIFIAFAGERGDRMAKIGRDGGLRVVREFFPDRAYTGDGLLLSRRSEGSLITDAKEAAERVLRAVEDNKVKAIDGTDILIEAQTVCVHSWQPLHPSPTSRRTSAALLIKPSRPPSGQR